METNSFIKKNSSSLNKKIKILSDVAQFFFVLVCTLYNKTSKLVGLDPYNIKNNLQFLKL